MDVRDLRRAVLGRLVAVRTWATWSPRRARTIAGVCLAVLVVSPVVAGVARSGGPDTAAAAPPPAPAASPTVDVAGPVPAPSGTDPATGDAGIPVVTAAPSGPADVDSSASDADQAAAGAAAQRFASLWLAGAFVPDRHRWATTMRDLVDPSLVTYLEATPASAIPRTSVTSVVPRLVAPAYGAVRVTFADGTGMDLDVSATGRTWRVVNYQSSAQGR